MNPRLSLGLIGACLMLLTPADAARAASPCRLAVIGDSLTAGFGVRPEEGFPSRLAAALAAEGVGCAVIDAGVSGDTSAGGAARLDWVLGDQPTHLLVELGANDGLRALPVDQLRRNIDDVVARAQAKGVSVMLAGMLPPPNLGREYFDAFAAVYPAVAEARRVPLYPFFLDGVALHPELIQPDGLHPNAAGVDEIVRRILPSVTAWLRGSPVAGAG